MSEFEGRQRNKDLFSLGLLAVVLLLAISLGTYDPADAPASGSVWLSQVYQADALVYPQNERIQNACGRLGAMLADSLFSAMGYAAYYLLICLGVLCYWLLAGRYKDFLFGRGLGWLISLVGITSLLQILIPQQSPGPITGSGGYIGLMVGGMLMDHFALAGSLVVAVGSTIIGLMMWTDYALLKVVQWMSHWGGAGLEVTRSAARNRLEGVLRRSSAESEIQDPDQSRSDAVGAHASHDESGYAPAVIIGGKRKESADEDPVELEESWEEEWDDAEEEWEDDSEPEDDDTTLLVKMPNVSNDHVEASDELDDEMSDEPEPMLVKTAAKKLGGLAPHIMGGKKKPTKEQEREAVKSQLADKIVVEVDHGKDYELPPLDLLTSGDGVSYEDQEREVRHKARLLEKTFKEFGFNIKVTEIETGPVIAQYELQLETGLRLSKIVGLADDLAIALRVPSVRIVAPIPGKNTVGVEVPNEHRQVVRLRDVIEECSDKTRKMKIPIFLGKDVSGNPMVADLAALPHLLIAGRTGTGKSVCLNAIISSILMTRRPEEVRMLMIDPKMVELSGYSKLPHLMHPVVTDMKKAEAILAWAVDKMEERYSLLAQAGVRHLVNYNQLGAEEIYRRLGAETEEEQEQIPTNLPFIVIIADEMADLMMTAGKTVEQWIIRLAQKSRAVGIHLILATQKPTVDVITGLIKSNLPARIAFQVASKTDSRVVLDENGADKLLGNGDMLFLGPGTSVLARGQGTFLGDDEITSIVESTAASGKQDFVTELVNLKVQEEDSGEGGGGGDNHGDDLYDSAVEAVIREQRGSVSMLQRIFKIGYGRAARLIDYMAEDGVVGPYNGKVREVIMTMEQWRSRTGEAAEEPESEPPRKRRTGPIRLHDDEADQDSSDDGTATIDNEARVPGVRKKVAPQMTDEEEWEEEEEESEFHDETDPDVAVDSEWTDPQDSVATGLDEDWDEDDEEYEDDEEEEEYEEEEAYESEYDDEEWEDVD